MQTKLILAALALLSASPVFINQAHSTEALIAQDTNSEEVDQSKKTYTSDGKEIQTVIALGIGTSPQGAAQNAAENALTQVVGSFIDAETVLTKKTEIRDGVVAKSKELSKKISDYSQGSIKSFEILNTTQNGSIYNVTARVDVRIDDFRAYIKELAYGSQEIDTGLFTAIKTEEDNIEGKLDLLAKVINPIINGEVVDINIGKPEKLDDLSAFGCITYYRNEVERPQINGSYLYCDQIYNHPHKKIYVSYPDILLERRSLAIPITFNIKRSYLENTKNILDNISDDKKVIMGRLESDRKASDFRGFNESNDYTFSIVDSKKNEWIHYYLPDAKSANLRRTANNIVPITIQRGCEEFPDFRISFSDKNKNNIFMREFTACDHGEQIRKDIIKIDRGSPSVDRYENQIYLYNLGSGYFDGKNISFFTKKQGDPDFRPTLFSKSPFVYKESAIYDKKRAILIIQMEDKYMDKIHNISLEYVKN